MLCINQNPDQNKPVAAGIENTDACLQTPKRTSTHLSQSSYHAAQLFPPSLRVKDPLSWHPSGGMNFPQMSKQLNQ